MGSVSPDTTRKNLGQWDSSAASRDRAAARIDAPARGASRHPRPPDLGALGRAGAMHGDDHQPQEPKQA
jgi:hypothetical protein